MVVAADGGEPMIALVAKGGAKVQADVNLAREPRDTLSWTGAPVVAAAPAGARLPAGAPWCVPRRWPAASSTSCRRA